MSSADGLKVTILGCGSSGGVPLINGNWGLCDPLNPKNRRRRPSILLEQNGQTVLVDAGPDCRNQLLDAGVKRLDALIITHDHADHTHGMDDLRFLIYGNVMPLPVFMTAETSASVHSKFGYCFEKTATNSLYPALFTDRIVTLGTGFAAGGIRLDSCWIQPHGRAPSLGFRIGDFAYSTDCVDLTEEHFQYLEGLDTWIVDTVRIEPPHRTHAHLEMSLDWVRRLQPRQTYLTHLSEKMDYDSLCTLLSPSVRPLYDGQVLTF